MVNALIYIGFTSPRAQDWRVFGPEVLGAQLAADGPDGAVRLRIDNAASRITVHPGDHDDVAYIGWDVTDDANLSDTIASLDHAGIAVTRDADLAMVRDVTTAAWFIDPFGFRHELTYGLRDCGQFVPGRAMSGFLTGDEGLGHAVLLVPDIEAGTRFFTEVLGFKLSDIIQDGGLGIRFFHCNQRHHSLALASVPGMAGMHHLMLEVNSIDDVGAALDIVNERGHSLAMSLGRHTNDLTTSFYVRTPSGFEIEYGTGGRLIDDATWEVGSYDSTSIWGHKSPAIALFPGILRPFDATPAHS